MVSLRAFDKVGSGRKLGAYVEWRKSQKRASVKSRANLWKSDAFIEGFRHHVEISRDGDLREWADVSGLLRICPAFVCARQCSPTAFVNPVPAMLLNAVLDRTRASP